MKCPRGCNDFGTQQGEMVPMSDGKVDWLHCYHCGRDAGFTSKPESQIHRNFSGLESEDLSHELMLEAATHGYKNTKYS